MPDARHHRHLHLAGVRHETSHVYVALCFFPPEEKDGGGAGQRESD